MSGVKPTGGPGSAPVESKDETRAAGSVAPAPVKTAGGEAEAPGTGAPGAMKTDRPSSFRMGEAAILARLAEMEKAGGPGRAEAEEEGHEGHVHAHGHAHTHAHGHASASSGNQVGGAGAARPASSTFATCKEAKEALERDFGVKVKEGDAKWSLEDLQRVHESFSRLSTDDRAKLKGLDVIREEKPPAKVQAEATAHGHGKVAGYYAPNVETKDGKRVKPPGITLYDDAFPEGDAAESRKTSIHVILHEAGHAVEGRERDDAMAASNAAIDRSNATVEKFNAANQENNASIASYGTAVDSANKAKPNDAKMGAFWRAQNSVKDALGRLGNATSQKDLDKATADLEAAKKKRDAALEAMGDSHGAKPAAEEVARAADAWEGTARARGQAGVEDAPAQKETKARKADLAKLNNDENESAELQKFAKFRKTSGEKPISDYGASEVGEDYAEAYALYRRDPTYLKESYPKTYAWFQKNHP